jgi:protein-serine/threonine kinase
MADHNRHHLTMNDFTTIKVIGKGTYGKVILVRKRASGELFAMKRIRKTDISRRN